MANNFITNNAGNQSLKSRLNTLITISDELKFLVGFFYFSGWKELYESLKANDKIQLKLLVGLQVDKLLTSMIIEHGAKEEGLSQEDHFNQFMSSLGNALNNEEMDTEAFYNQVSFFLQMIHDNRLLIRKTENPNHAKLYLFKLNQPQSKIQNMPGQFVTGSSNLTKAGLGGQQEFNVEIKDYGFKDAEAYFDELWEKAIPITEIDDRKRFLTQFIEHKSLAATVTPFEAYALILKTYVDLQQQKVIRPEVEEILENIGFRKFTYQLDSVNQALSIINEYNGVIIADVVGLGKSVIASLIAKNLGKRGMVICPPGLIGDKNLDTGWWQYINQFKLYDWQIESRGKLEEIAENTHNKDIDVVIVDEAHYFRNQDTADYEALQNICRDKIVILLTATPFNNSPADIFSLLKLFIIPGKSGITFEDNLENLFLAHNYRFKRLSDISKYHNSGNPERVKKAEKLYVQLLGKPLPIDMEMIRSVTRELANQIKNTISSVVIRRNRLDLQSDYEYSKELEDMSKVRDPDELFYYLDPKQSEFYDRIISQYFIEDGRFTGAIYQPYSYKKAIKEDDDLGEEGNRAFQQQRNLFDFMRRLLVKRFESSFGAFASSIDRFLKVHQLVRDFIDSSGGKHILDRKLIEKMQAEELEEEEISQVLDKFENDLLKKKILKNNEVYIIKDFERAEEFVANIENDIQLFKDIKEELKQLDLVNNDPKRESLINAIGEITHNGGQKRKIIIFSEYVDTIKHLEFYIQKKMKYRVLVCDGKITKALAKSLDSDFNAQYKGHQNDHFDVLLTSDKLSEGFNLNRAGAIINYDIPWNPTRVIQRLGRINRIGIKVYDELYIYNFFPSEAGADIVKSREISAQKMFLIHNSLGEDSKIFDADEEPTPAGLFHRVSINPETEEDLNVSTVIRNRYKSIRENYPEIVERISGLPNRVKSSKSYKENQINVLRKKGLSLFAQAVDNPSKSDTTIKEITIEELIPRVECEFGEKHVGLSGNFWSAYEKIKSHKPQHKINKSEASLEKKAFINLKSYLKIIDPRDEAIASFIKVLIKDIKNYKTLSQRTLGRLGRIKLNENPSDKVKKNFLEEIIWIRNNLGDNYLNRILKRVEHQRNEVIIAVENIYMAH